MSSAHDAAREYAQLLLKQHELDPRGQEESLELNAICEAMDAPWEDMDGLHRRLMRGLSQDLYALANGRSDKLMSPDHQREWAELGRAAYQSRDPVAYLNHLRQPFPYGPFNKGWIAFFQAGVWWRIGFPEVAIPFFQEAGKTLPLGGTYAMVLLEQLRRFDEAAEIARGILSDPKAEHLDYYLAASSMFVMASDLAPNSRNPILEGIIGPMRRILAEERRNRFWHPDPDKERAIASLLAFTLASLGRRGEAMDICREALVIHPDDPTILTVQGLVRLQDNPIDAEADFARAVKGGARLIAPYVAQSLILLEKGAYADVLRLCDQAFRLGERIHPRLMAWLFEARGIALAETGDSQARVEEEFSRAENLDPESGERIRTNRALAIQRMGSHKAAARWSLPGVGQTIKTVVLAAQQPSQRELLSEQFFTRLTSAFSAA